MAGRLSWVQKPPAPQERDAGGTNNFGCGTALLKEVHPRPTDSELPFTVTVTEGRGPFPLTHPGVKSFTTDPGVVLPTSKVVPEGGGVAGGPDRTAARPG